MRFQFIYEHKQEFAVRLMCKVQVVSESGYYAWRKRPESARAKADRELGAEIEPIFEQSLE